MKPAGASHQLELTTPSDLEIVMTRVFEAPRTMVYDAFTKPELIRKWLLGPDGWSMPVCDVDLRAGGQFHYLWRNDTDGKEFGMHGTYREVVPSSRIVHAENFDEPWYDGDAIVTTSFVEREGSTTVEMKMRFVSRAVRDQALESGMERGVARSYDRLADVLAGRP